jgi:hypothetical protein
MTFLLFFFVLTFLKDFREGDVTVYDLLDFMFNSVVCPFYFFFVCAEIPKGLKGG